MVCCTFVFAQWDKYPTYGAYIDIMDKFESDYPDLCRIVEFGQSVQGRKLLCAKVSDNIGVKEAEPGFMYSSTIHGDEPAGFVLMLHLIDYLLSNYGKDALVTRIVDSVEIWINPLFNPDGAYWHTSNPEPPKHTNANDVDLDRNFPNPLQGPHPDGHEWQPETKAMMALADSVGFVMSANFHSGAELVAYPFSTWTSSEHPHVDREWWEFVCKEYADTAQKNSPNGYMSGTSGGVINSGMWYIVYGERIDYMNYFAHCREVMIEISAQKLLPESQLPDYWEYNYRSFLHYIEQALYGIRGTVKDSITSVPIEAKVFVENHDEDSSWVFSNLPHGDYYRPLYKGTYEITFSADGYIPKTITGVLVENHKATMLDVKLSKDPTGIISENKKLNMTISVCNGSVKISFNNNFNSNMQLAIFDVSGRLIKELRAGPDHNSIVWNMLDNNGNTVSSGYYIARLICGDHVIYKHFIVTP